MQIEFLRKQFRGLGDIRNPILATLLNSVFSRLQPPEPHHKKVYDSNEHRFNRRPEHHTACKASPFFTAYVGLLVVNGREPQKFKCFRTIQRKISFGFWHFEAKGLGRSGSEPHHYGPGLELAPGFRLRNLFELQRWTLPELNILAVSEERIVVRDL
jgi:hypothetical protein